LLYKLSEIKFSISLIKLIGSFLSQRKFRVSVENEISTLKDIQAGVSQGFVLSPVLYSINMNDSSGTTGVYLGIFPDDTCIYVTHRKEGCVLRKLQRGLSAIETWCECWNIDISEDETGTIYSSHRRRSSGAHLTLNGPNISFVNLVKYLGVIFDKRITWRLHI
jgi:hypothetical protein